MKRPSFPKKNTFSRPDFDDTEIPGLHKDISYIDLRKKTPKQFAEMIIQKLGRSIVEAEEETSNAEISDDDIPF